MYRLVIALCLAHVAIAINLSSSTSFKEYQAAMIGLDACSTIVKNSKQIPVDKSCGKFATCNYPDQICVQTVGKNFFDSSPDFACVDVPSSCQTAVKAESKSSGSAGAGGGTRPSATTRRPAATTRRPAATRAPATSKPSSSGGGQDPKCKEKFGDRGTFSGGRVTRVYGWNGSSCAQYVYMGTGGTNNRFTTEASCKSACASGGSSSSSSSSSSSTSSGSSSSSGGSSKCSEAQKAGEYKRGAARTANCSIARRYYWDGSKCQFFWYSGCGGNGNNFSSQTECTKTCG